MHIAAVAWFIPLKGLSLPWSFLKAPKSPAGFRVSSTPLTSAKDCDDEKCKPNQRAKDEANDGKERCRGHKDDQS